eukprot:2085502-Rhodomonas_salina.1
MSKHKLENEPPLLERSLNFPLGASPLSPFRMFDSDFFNSVSLTLGCASVSAPSLEWRSRGFLREPDVRSRANAIEFRILAISCKGIQSGAPPLENDSCSSSSFDVNQRFVADKRISLGFHVNSVPSFCTRADL